jgi:3-oxoacyl-[acyl-carrier-protein] synthase II
MGLIRQCLLKRASPSHNHSPADSVRPFDIDASGLVIAEGAGLLILEEYHHASSRSATIYAELIGFGASQDTYKLTEPDPTGHSYSKAITSALADAHISPDQVGCLIPHGLGIPSHDRAELAALHAAFGPSLQQIPLAPIKAQTGNLAAASGVDAAAAVLALHHAKIPPAINTRNVIDGAVLNVSTSPRDSSFNIALSSVYSLGGQNAALVFRRI